MVTVHRSISTEDKLEILAESAKHDVCLVTCNSRPAGGRGRLRDPADPLHRWVYPTAVPGRGGMSMLKVLMTNGCSRRCRYCGMGADNGSLRRVTFRPDELAALFMSFVRLRLVHGLFLSSGIPGNADEIMTRMIETAAILRNKYRFSQYIHLKILPGVSDHLIEAAGRYANRLSLNLEAPTAAHLARIAPEKDFKREIVRKLMTTGRLIREGKIRTAGQTTQFVVGPSGESDADILKSVDWLYRESYVFRSYFSSYQPPTNQLPTCRSETDPFESGGVQISAPESSADALVREHRLYQCDFLMRAYGFRFPDLIFDSDGNLPLRTDPKTAYAMMHPELFPVDVNRADEASLLKVPGIGPVAAERIVAARREHPYRRYEDLRPTGAVVKRTEGYLVFSGRRDADAQGWLFEVNPPETWRTRLTPLAPERLSGREYVYPAQQGKTVNYVMSERDVPVYCR